MAMTPDARIAGSVSGGCVEGAVVEEGRLALQSGEPKLLRFGVDDETAWNVGLSCGGTLEVFVEPLTDELYEALSQSQNSRTSLVKVTVIRGADAGAHGTRFVFENDDSRDEIGVLARDALASGRPARRSLESGAEVFFDVELPSPTLVMVGGVHIAISLSTMAHTLGFRTVVADPRGVFGSKERFPNVDELLDDWPDEALKKIGLVRTSAVATLTHDPKLDDPALEVALRSPAFYVGALGSRKTNEKRRKRLLDRGVTEEEFARLHAPIGLDIGSATPEEIALSIIGEIVAEKNRRAV
jgi:xanthine dehydrogenase accessory factor